MYPPELDVVEALPLQRARCGTQPVRVTHGVVTDDTVAAVEDVHDVDELLADLLHVLRVRQPVEGDVNLATVAGQHEGDRTVQSQDVGGVQVEADPALAEIIISVSVADTFLAPPSRTVSKSA